MKLFDITVALIACVDRTNPKIAKKVNMDELKKLNTLFLRNRAKNIFTSFYMYV